MIKKLNALKNQKGMTLVELLAVMVIIGIIAAISIPAIGNLLNNSRKDAAIATAQAVQDAARLYVTSNNISDDIVLTAVGTKAEDGDDLVVAKFLDKVPTDPNNNKYTIARVEVSFDSDTGEISYITTLSDNDGKYNLQGDALKLERADVTSTPRS